MRWYEWATVAIVALAALVVTSALYVFAVLAGAWQEEGEGEA